jgi:flagellar protein FliO/FliZ
MTRNVRLLVLGLAAAAVAPAAMAVGLAGPGHTAVSAAPDAASLAAPLLRMVLSLGAGLGVVWGLAWLAKRLRQGGSARAGMIEILSGVSLGTRDKVVLLRVGSEQVLVGVSPSGMRALHVLRDGTTPAAPFDSLLGKEPS